MITDLCPHCRQVIMLTGPSFYQLVALEALACDNCGGVFFIKMTVDGFHLFKNKALSNHDIELYNMWRG